MREREKTVAREGRKKAIIVSVSDYKNDLQPLDFCRNDGQELSDLLVSLGYDISDNYRLIGRVNYQTMREAIIDFFTDPETKAEDTLVFYFSGHGIPDVDGDIYLASSEIDPDSPFRRGFSFNELTKMIQRSISTRIVTILDCCYSGAAKISKGHQDDAAKLGTIAIDNKSAVLQQGEGRCLLAASLSYQEAYGLKEENHSIFTYYLLQGLRGNENSVDAEGNITPDSLSKYVYRTIVNLPQDRKPKQTPIRKIEAGGDIILAHYSEFAKTKIIGDSLMANNVGRSLDLRKKSSLYAFKADAKYRRTLLKVLTLVSSAVILVVLVNFVHMPLIQNNYVTPSSNLPQSTSVTKAVTDNRSQVTYVSIVPGSSSSNNIKFYDPSSVKISTGHAVRWINNDSIIHTVTSGIPNKGLMGKSFDSKLLKSGSTFTFTFVKAGSYPYYCILHPYMTGQVIAE